MKWTSAIAVYFIIWWVTLFAVLPWGVRSAAEAGEEVEEGNDAGAPVNPRLGFKALVTTAVASVLFVLIYTMLTQEWFGLDDLPF